MTSFRARFALAIFLISLAPAVAARGSIWARDGASLKPLDREGTTAVWTSPDRHAELRVDANHATLKMGSFTTNVDEIYSSIGLTELSWSDAANGVFINASDGGVVGTWQSRVFVETGGRVKEVPVQRLIADKSVLSSDCKALNLASLAWIDNGKHLLVLQEVPNSSGCTNMADTALYVIDLGADQVVEVLHGKAGLKYNKYLAPVVRELLRGRSYDQKE